MRTPYSKEYRNYRTLNSLDGILINVMPPCIKTMLVSLDFMVHNGNSSYWPALFNLTNTLKALILVRPCATDHLFF